MTQPVKVVVVVNIHIVVTVYIVGAFVVAIIIGPGNLTINHGQNQLLLLPCFLFFLLSCFLASLFPCFIAFLVSLFLACLPALFTSLLSCSLAYPLT